MIRRGGAIDSSQWTCTVELVEPESAVVDEGGSAGGFGLGLPVPTVESVLSRGEHRWDRIGAVYVSDVCQFRGT
jgi:hypothetical protein